MILVDGTKVASHGTGTEMLSDAAIALTEAIKRVSHGDSVAATAMLSAVVATTVSALRKREVSIDNEKVVQFIYNNLKELKE